MAFNTFLQLGQADRFEPRDLLEDDDFEDFTSLEDDGLRVPPQDRDQPAQPDPSKLELERIQARNRELEAERQRERVENARQLGAMDQRLKQLEHQRQSNIQDPKQADEFVENFWAKRDSTPQQATSPKQAPTQGQYNIEQVVDQRVDQRLGSLAQKQAEAQKQENDLAERFKREHANLIQAGAGPEAYREWERLKALRGDLPAEQRYNLMVHEMQTRYANAPKGFSAPNSESKTVASQEMQDMFSTDPRSERQRQVRKAKDTARRVKSFRDEQLKRTSIPMG